MFSDDTFPTDEGQPQGVSGPGLAAEAFAPAPTALPEIKAQYVAHLQQNGDPVAGVAQAKLYSMSNANKTARNVLQQDQPVASDAGVQPPPSDNTANLSSRPTAAGYRGSDSSGRYQDRSGGTSSLVGFPEDGTEQITGRKFRYLTDCEKGQLRDRIPGADLDNVKVHEGEYPWWLPSDMIGVTLGNDVYFRPGVYDPSTSKGIGLLGHELVHVGQFRNGMTRGGYVMSALRHGYRTCPEEEEAYAKQDEITGIASGCGNR